MWNWESECWGEKNVATFHQLEEELVGQCLQTPVDGSLDTRSMPAMKTAASMVQPHVASYLRPAATYPFMQVRAVNLYFALQCTKRQIGFFFSLRAPLQKHP